MDMEMLEDHLEEPLVRENAEGLTVSIQDRISNLHREIIDSILVKLPIKDAARTSVLSQKWRYRWHSMLNLMFGRKSLIQQQSKCVKQQEDGWKKLARIVDQVLVVHTGPIREFSLVAGLPAASDVDRWLIHLMRVDISCLTLWFLYGRLRLSSHVFACELLDKLILHRCELSLPVSFRGFPRLKSLKLCSVLVSDDGLGLLISNCPCLEQLVLLGVKSCHHLEIYAPMLVKLILHGAFHDLCFAYSPELISANIGLSLSRDNWHSFGKTRSLDKVFGGIRTMKQLFLGRTIPAVSL